MLYDHRRILDSARNHNASVPGRGCWVRRKINKNMVVVLLFLLGRLNVEAHDTFGHSMASCPNLAKPAFMPQISRRTLCTGRGNRGIR